MISEVSTLCVSEGDWAEPTKTKPLGLSSTDLHFDHDITPLLPSSFTLQNDTTDRILDNYLLSNCAQLGSFADMNDPYTSPELDLATLSGPAPESVEYAPQSNSSYDSITISPQELCTNASSTSTDLSFSVNGQMDTLSSLEYYGFPDDPDPDPFTSKSRRDSAHTSIEGIPPTKKRTSSGRKRKTENVEPDSTRAIYLEKNRQAASKCRSKQKKKEDELVETARHEERRNKVLKAEVDVLKSDVRNLMDIVGQHAGCPDARLMTYLQREADRLVSGSGVSSFSSKTSSKTTRESLSQEKS